MRLEHGIQHALQETDLVSGMAGGQLGDRVAGRVHESVDAGSRRLVVGAANFEVVWGDDMVGGRDVGVEICFGDIFGEGLALFWVEGKLCYVKWSDMTNYLAQ